MRVTSIAWVLFLVLGCNHVPDSASAGAEKGQNVASLEPLPTTGPATVAIGARVVQSSVKRLGINLSQYSNYGTGQILKNLVARNPGFEGWEYRSIVEVSAAQPDGFVDVAPPGGWQDGFWDQAEFEVIWGQALGRSGVVAQFKRGQEGNRYVCQGRGPAFAKGDQVVLRQRHKGNPTGGWWTEVAGTASFSSGAQRPDSAGEQSLLFDARAGGSLKLHGYFDPVTASGQCFMPLRGPYVLRFWARALSPNTHLDVRVARLLTPHREYLRQSVDLIERWHAYELPFEASDDDQQGVVDLEFKLDGGHLLLDDVSLSMQPETEPTPFSDAVVSTLHTLQPGILRGWAGQLGDSLDNQLCAPGTQRMNGYSRWGQEPKVLGYGLPAFLQLCERLDAEAWYVLPLSFSASERRQLIEFLAGPVDTPMGKRRADLGHPTPWTESLRAIHLELGNEAWNGTFKGGNLERPEVYGQVASAYFADLRKAPGFDGAKLKLVLGGQAVYMERNQSIVKQGAPFDHFAIAPYLLHTLDVPATEGEPLLKLYAEIEGLRKGGYVQQNLKMLASSGKPANLSVYEVNLHTTDGSADEAVVNQLVTSVGASVALGAHMLQMVQMGIRDQCFYTLNQFDFQRPDKKNVRLWGALRDLSAGGRKRPSYEVLTLLNRALEGDLLEVGYGGSIEPIGLGQVQIERPIAVYCTRKGSSWHLLAFNYDPNRTRELQLRLPGLPQSAVHHSWLKYENPTDNNEDATRVTLAEETLSAMPQALVLRPGGLHLWSSSL